MRGIIVKWNDEKGYGFIQIEGSKKEIFCHISDFSQRSPRPEINEAVAFELASNEKGKVAAKRIRYLNREVRDFERHHNYRPAAKKKSFSLSETSSSVIGWFSSVLARLVGLILLGLIGYQIYQFAAAKLASKQVNLPINFKDPFAIKTKKSNSGKYRCDGRQYCSQMTSCEEAEWFLQNCSDTKMDGDGDGIPCEDRCGGW